MKKIMIIMMVFILLASSVIADDLYSYIGLYTDDGDVYVRTELDSPRNYFVQTGSGAIVFSVPQP